MQVQQAVEAKSSEVPECVAAKEKLLRMAQARFLLMLLVLLVLPVLLFVWELLSSRDKLVRPLDLRTKRLAKMIQFFICNIFQIRSLREQIIIPFHLGTFTACHPIS